MANIDILATQQHVNYMDLFHKVNEYARPAKTGKTPVEKAKEIFTPGEMEFLSCVALEYLIANGINGPQELTSMERKTVLPIVCPRCGHKFTD